MNQMEPSGAEGVVAHKLIHDIVRGSIHQTSGTKLRSLSIRGIEILQAPSTLVGTISSPWCL
jgi:hypothetical protein